MADFDILEYLSGLTGFIFDKAVLKRIAMERGVLNATNIGDIDKKTRDLLLADLLLTVYMSPNTSASISQTHGSFSQTIGSQTITDREGLYNMFISLYRKWDDDKLEDVQDLGGTLQWLE